MEKCRRTEAPSHKLFILIGFIYGVTVGGAMASPVRYILITCSIYRCARSCRRLVSVVFMVPVISQNCLYHVALCGLGSAVSFSSERDFSECSRGHRGYREPLCCRHFASSIRCFSLWARLLPVLLLIGGYHYRRGRGIFPEFPALCTGGQ